MSPLAQPIITVDISRALSAAERLEDFLASIQYRQRTALLNAEINVACHAYAKEALHQGSIDPVAGAVWSPGDHLHVWAGERAEAWRLALRDAGLFW